MTEKGLPIVLYDNDFSYIIMTLANFQADKAFNCADF